MSCVKTENKKSKIIANRKQRKKTWQCKKKGNLWRSNERCPKASWSKLALALAKIENFRWRTSDRGVKKGRLRESSLFYELSVYSHISDDTFTYHCNCIYICIYDYICICIICIWIGFVSTCITMSISILVSVSVSKSIYIFLHFYSCINNYVSVYSQYAYSSFLSIYPSVWKQTDVPKVSASLFSQKKKMKMKYNRTRLNNLLLLLLTFVALTLISEARVLHSLGLSC